MAEKQPYQSEVETAGFAGESDSAETKHRDAARGGDPNRAELNPEQRNREDPYGPRTHQDTRIDPDPRFEEAAERDG